MVRISIIAESSEEACKCAAHLQFRLGYSFGGAKYDYETFRKLYSEQFRLFTINVGHPMTLNAFQVGVVGIENDKRFYGFNPFLWSNYNFPIKSVK